MAETIKVALVYHNLAVGGVQKKIIDILQSAVESKKTERIVLILGKKTGIFLPLVPAPVKIIDLGIDKNSNWYLLFPFKLLAAVWREKPDLILAFMDVCGCSAILVKQLLFWRKMKVDINENVMLSEFYKYRLFGGLRKLLVKIFYPGADAVLAISESMRRDLIRNFGLLPARVIVTPNRVSASFLKIQKKTIKKDIDLLYVGRFETEKNLIFLLRIFADVVKKRPETNLYLIGEGRDRERLKEKIGQLNLTDKVFIAGPVADTQPYFRRAKIFVLTSLSEGVPLALLEAMAAGIPAVVPDIPAMRQLAGRETGIIKAQGQKQFVKAILRLMKNKSRQQKLLAEPAD